MLIVLHGRFGRTLFYFLEGYTPEEINAIYPDLSLEKIYATITYYLQNRQKIGLFSTLCDNQCLLFVGVLLGKALRIMFLDNYPYSSSFHTETRRAKNWCLFIAPPELARDSLSRILKKSALLDFVWWFLLIESWNAYWARLLGLFCGYSISIDLVSTQKPEEPKILILNEKRREKL